MPWTSKKDEDRRTELVQMRASPNEMASYRQKAKAAGLSFAEWVRACCQGQAPGMDEQALPRGVAFDRLACRVELLEQFIVAREGWETAEQVARNCEQAADKRHPL